MRVTWEVCKAIFIFFTLSAAVVSSLPAPPIDRFHCSLSELVQVNLVVVECVYQSLVPGSVRTLTVFALALLCPDRQHLCCIAPFAEADNRMDE